MSSVGDDEDGINFEDGSNLELGPVLSVLTEEQKNLLICQAIQKDPSLAELVLQKVAERLFPREGASLDRHHSFVVQYEEGKDLGLDMHVDNSDVTFNVCLGREFTGATAWSRWPSW